MKKRIRKTGEIIGRILTASIPGKAAGKEAMTVQSKANIIVYIVPDVVNY